MYSEANVQVLLNELFALPSRPLDMGRIATLPESSYKLPREKHVRAPFHHPPPLTLSIFIINDIFVLLFPIFYGC